MPAAGSDMDEYQSSTNASHSTDLDAPLRPIEQERKLRSKQRNATHISFVTMTPQIVPGAGVANQSPITTWGTVEGTPVNLSGQDIGVQFDAGPNGALSSFCFAPENARELAARQAESDIARCGKKTSSLSSFKQRTISASASLLPPAPLSLYDKIKQTPSRTRDAFASALRTSYSQQPHSLRVASKSQGRGKRDHAYNETPMASRGQQKGTKR